MTRTRQRLRPATRQATSRSVGCSARLRFGCAALVALLAVCGSGGALPTAHAAPVHTNRPRGTNARAAHTPSTAVLTSQPQDRVEVDPDCDFSGRSLVRLPSLAASFQCTELCTCAHPEDPVDMLHPCAARRRGRRCGVVAVVAAVARAVGHVLCCSHEMTAPTTRTRPAPPARTHIHARTHCGTRTITRSHGTSHDHTVTRTRSHAHGHTHTATHTVTHTVTHTHTRRSGPQQAD